MDPNTQDTGNGEQATSDVGSREAAAKKIVRRNVFWALGLGAIPIPVVDLAGLMVAQVKMIRELAKHYDVEFSESRAKAIVTALCSTIGSHYIRGAIAMSVVKMIPILGQALVLVTLPILGGALTRTIGNLFVMHFESGRTLLDFDAVAMREHFKKEFESNKIVVERLVQSREKPRKP